MEITKYISKALEIMISNEHAEDKLLLEMFDNLGIPKVISIYLLFFIPIAFSRIVCKEFNIDFTDDYTEHKQNGRIQSNLLSKNEIFVKVYKFSETFIESGPSSDVIMKISLRSPEFQIINENFLKGLDVSKIKFSAFHIIL